MTCYQAIDLMGDALEGGLAAEARAGFAGHLEECAPCRNYMDQLRLTRQALGNLPWPGEAGARRSELIDRYRKEFRGGE